MENKWIVVRINRSNSDTFAAHTLEGALELAMPDDGSVIEHGTVTARDAGMARLMRPAQWTALETACPYGCDAFVTDDNRCDECARTGLRLVGGFYERDEVPAKGKV